MCDRWRIFAGEAHAFPGVLGSDWWLRGATTATILATGTLGVSGPDWNGFR